MTLPQPVVITLILVLAFLSSSTFYLFNKNRSGAKVTHKSLSAQSTFKADLPQLNQEINSRIDSQTKPATPRNRVSYPTNTYTVTQRESLATVAAKFSLTWQLLKSVNGIEDENLIQSGDELAIPKLNPETDSYRLGFTLNEQLASQMNRPEADDPNLPTNEHLLDPLTVAKRDAPPYFSLRGESEFHLLEADFSIGTALVESKNTLGEVILIGLIQPKAKGKNGFWVLWYVEKRPS